MKLDRTTYEAWLLDRAEGSLTPEQERELDAFLAMNPDLADEAEELPALSDEAIPFGMKAELKKGFPPTGDIDQVRLNDFLAARLEGDLNGAQEKALDRFLYDHPEAQRDARLMAMSKVDKTHVAFKDKQSLVRIFPPQGLPHKHRLTDLLIAAREGDLDEEQRAALSSYIGTHTEAQREERLIAATYVDREQVVFSGKEQLKKQEVRVLLMWQRYAAAASVALLIGIAWWSMRGTNENGQRLARTEQVPKHSPGQSVPHVVPGISDSASGARQPLTVPSLRSTNDKDAAPSSRDTSSGKVPYKVPIPVGTTPPVQEPRWAQQDIAPNNHRTEAPHEGTGSDTTNVHKDEVPVLRPDPAPSLAQQNVVPKNVAIANEREDERGLTLAALAADAVRKGVLDAPKRGTALDAHDALAIVDKGLQAITRGEGALEVHSTAARQHFGLRLGGFSISASRGR